MARIQTLSVVTLICLLASACGKEARNYQTIPPPVPESDPVSIPVSRPQAMAGGPVFRHETFGNEGYWTDAARLPQGMLASGLTPLQTLRMGLSIDQTAIGRELRRDLVEEISAQGHSGPLLNDPEITRRLLNANAVIGLVVRDTDRDGAYDVGGADKLGVSCALCHSTTDAGMLSVSGGGSIGRRIDGPSADSLQIGKLFALAGNTRALYPLAQLKRANGTSLGRARTGLTATSNEEAFDAYFSDPTHFPPGMGDTTFDGVGNPTRIPPLYRLDLSAPYGAAGDFASFDQYANTFYTGVLDPTNLLTADGRTLLRQLLGAEGDKLADDYGKVLGATGVSSFPYVLASSHGEPGRPDSWLGVRVETRKLAELRAYLEELRPPAGVPAPMAALARGRAVYGNSRHACLSCHNSDPARPVYGEVLPMRQVFPADRPMPPWGDTAGARYDDRIVVVNANLRREPRGLALPLLMGLARRTALLHDGTVPDLSRLFDPARGTAAPHPFYVEDPAQRQDLVVFLRALGDREINVTPARP